MKMKLALLVASALISVSASAAECVILLHGLARSAASMEKMAEVLVQADYTVVNHDYPSRHHPIAHLAENEIPKAVQDCGHADTIHFVTHSLGGILVRYYLENHQLDALGRVVMLGPPNNGSQVVDHLKHVPGFKLLNGEAGMALGTEPGSVPTSLGDVDFELGVIAGTHTINLILSTFLPNPDDGKVSVESTKVPGMNDHVTVPVSHPFLMKDDDVISHVLTFLKSGKFESGESQL
jgi:pimeloyl-ACP methyl ester carboxylesterase